MNSKVNSKSTKKKKYGNFLYDFVKVTGAVPALIWLRPKLIWHGKKGFIKGGFMASANHCDFSDPVFVQCIFWNRRISFLATKDLFNSKIKNAFFERMHCIKVDKENFSIDSFHEVVDQLKQDKIVSIFPEGRVDVGSEKIHTFKSGVVLMAFTANKPIIPMYFVPPKKWYNRRIAVIGEPINVREMCGNRPSAEAFNEVSKYLREKEKELQRFYNEKCDKRRKNQVENTETNKIEQEALK